VRVNCWRPFDTIGRTPDDESQNSAHDGFVTCSPSQEVGAPRVPISDTRGRHLGDLTVYLQSKVLSPRRLRPKITIDFGFFCATS